MREAVCGDDAASRKDFKVYLVAHFMGGLVCRCYLQNICRHGAPRPEDDAALELVPGKLNLHYADKFFTYATPLNGIDMFGLNTPGAARSRRHDTALMFAIEVGIRVPAFEIDKKFWFDEHFEGFLYRETITFAVRTGSIRYGLASLNGIGAAPTRAEPTDTADGAREISIALATRKGALPGFRGKLVLRAEPWNTGPDG